MKTQRERDWEGSGAESRGRESKSGTEDLEEPKKKKTKSEEKGRPAERGSEMTILGFSMRQVG